MSVEEFCNMYEDIGLPFWMQTRPETISDYKIKKLAEIGLHRISFGIECGNPDFRQKVLLRKPSNQEIIDSFKRIHASGISFSANF